MRCLYIGRFQPFHAGHLDVVHQVYMQGYTHIVIAIGSCATIDDRNRRTYPERRTIIQQALTWSAIDASRYSIIGIPDFTHDEDRLAYIQESVDYDVIISWNMQVKSIFASTDTLLLQEQERVPIRATDLRNMLARWCKKDIIRWVPRAGPVVLEKTPCSVL